MLSKYQIKISHHPLQHIHLSFQQYKIDVHIHSSQYRYVYIKMYINIDQYSNPPLIRTIILQLKKQGLTRGKAQSLSRGDNLVQFYYLQASESGLIREVIFGGSGLIREVIFGGSGPIREVIFGGSGLIKWMVFDGSGLKRWMAFGGSGLIRGELTVI